MTVICLITLGNKCDGYQSDSKQHCTEHRASGVVLPLSHLRCNLRGLVNAPTYPCSFHRITHFAFAIILQENLLEIIEQETHPLSWLTPAIALEGEHRKDKVYAS